MLRSAQYRWQPQQEMGGSGPEMRVELVKAIVFWLETALRQSPSASHSGCCFR